MRWLGADPSRAADEVERTVTVMLQRRVVQIEEQVAKGAG
jgi:hypothetical protein